MSADRHPKAGEAWSRVRSHLTRFERHMDPAPKRAMAVADLLAIEIRDAVLDEMGVLDEIERLRGASLPALGTQMLADSRAWFGEAEVPWRDVLHFTLGLAGESGEVVDAIKKADVCDGQLTTTCEYHAEGKHSLEAVAAEMADVLTYLLALAALLDVDIEAAYRAKRAENVARWGDPARSPLGGDS